MATASVLSAYLTGESWVAKNTGATHPPREQIRELAYHLYELRGHRDGHAVEDWLCAEAQLVSDPDAWAHTVWSLCDGGETS
jgi:hypothetical protein